MNRKYIFIFLLTCCSYHGISQSNKVAKPSYKTAIGMRIFPFGLSLKSNVEYRKRSFEIIGYFRDGFTGSFLYYWNFTLNQTKNLKLYAGGSSQLGFLNERNGGGAQFGIGGVLGVDYKFLHMPLNISADWQPTFQIGNNNDFRGWGGLAARFTL